MKKLIGFLLLFNLYICSSHSRNEFIQNPNPTQYFAAGSAFTQPAGSILYKNTCLFFNPISFGLTDNISLGGGTELYRLITSNEKDKSPSLYYLAPKIGFRLAPKLRFAVGGDVLFYREGLFDADNHTGTQIARLGYGLLTYGSVNSNVTIGGYAVPVNGDMNGKGIFFNISGIHKIGRMVALVGESWFFPDQSSIIDGGFRIFEKNVAVDLGVASYLGVDTQSGSIFIPYADFTWSF